MIKEKAFLLADKLESRGYRQANGVLKEASRTFCCLGVACQVAGMKSKFNDDNLKWEFEGNFDYLPPSVQKEFGFYSGTGARKDGKMIIINGFEGREFSSLADANDGNVPFKKIAKYIRENYKYL